MKADQAKKSMESLKALTMNKSIRNRLERERCSPRPQVSLERMCELICMMLPLALAGKFAR